MLNILNTVLTKWRLGTPMAITTIISTRDSAPLPVGSSQMTTPGGEVFGSVSGGCVESAVYEANMACLEGSGPQLNVFGFSDSDAWAAGLTCGGTLETYTEMVNSTTLPWLEELADATTDGPPVALLTVVSSGIPTVECGAKMLIRQDAVSGSLGSAAADAWAAGEARKAIGKEQRHGVFGLGGDAGLRAFVQVFTSKPRLIIFGAIDFAAALAQVGALLDYRVTVCDARKVFLTKERFPAAHELVNRWPHDYLAAEVAAGGVDERSALCVLTHDAKFDVPLLSVALRLPWGNYVGAMGSRRTHAERNERLLAEGLGAGDLGRLHSPLGLDLGAVTPAETAVSIMAEIVAFRAGRGGTSLSSASGPIHGAASFVTV